MPSSEVIEIFQSTRALLKGHFILRSGLHSEHYFQCAQVCQYLDKVSRLAEMLIQKMGPIDCQTVIAPAMGGLVIGQEIARQLKLRYIFVDKVEGRLELKRNFKIQPGERMLVVEDVITRGGRAQETLDIIHEHQGKPVAVAVLVDRSEGKAKFNVPLHSLLQQNFPTYNANALPEHLKCIPALKIST
jgi:orotate phosphoribosyltransferase